MQSVENLIFLQKQAFFYVEDFVEKEGFLSNFIHTFHRIHALHILSTFNFHDLWKSFI